MANESGSVYGLTILSPILQDEKAQTSHNCAIREYLAQLPRDEHSPFARVSSTHMARLVVMDDVVFVGHPAHEEHLQSQYLVFETNFDGELDAYLLRMVREIPEEVNKVWEHCWGFPGVQDEKKFVEYMKKCQVTTTFYFADVNDKTVQQTLRALQVQAAVAKFIEEHQGMPAAALKKEFTDFLKNLEALPAPVPGRAEGDDPPHIHTEMHWAARYEKPEQAKGVTAK